MLYVIILILPFRNWPLTYHHTATFMYMEFAVRFGESTCMFERTSGHVSTLGALGHTRNG